MTDIELLRRALAPADGSAVSRSARRRPDEVYTVVPNAAAPRLLLPSRRRRVAAAAIRQAIAPSGRSARLRQAMLGWLFRIGIGRWSLGDVVFRDRLRIGSAGSLRAVLAGAFGVDVELCVRLGPPRANRKPVVAVLDRRGIAVAFAKLGVDPLTRDLVADETAALVALARRDVAPARVPAVRYAGVRSDGVAILAVDALPVADASPGAEPERCSPVAAAMRAVAGRPFAARLSGSDYLAGLAARVDALGDRPGTAPLRAAIDQAARCHLLIDFGAWHGDWNGGNLALRGPEVLLWDWERYSTGVPVGFDALHYALHEEVTVRGTDPVPAVAWLAGHATAPLSAVGVPPAHASALVALYLVEIATRYLGDGQEFGSTRLGRVAEWIEPALAATGQWWDTGNSEEVALRGA
jgi:hypothetical protein